MFETLETWLAAHPVTRGVLYALLVAAAGSFVNWVTYKRTPEAWARYEIEHPYRAYLIRVCRALFPHLRKIPQLAPFIPPPSDRRLP